DRTARHAPRRRPARARRREQDPAADKRPAARGRDEPHAPTGQLEAEPADEHRIGAVAQRRDRHERRTEHYDLPHIGAVRIDELRDERAEEQQYLRVAQHDQETLQKETAAGPPHPRLPPPPPPSHAPV